MSNLIVGKTYRVEGDDCCIQVLFTAVCIEVLEYGDARWDNGVYTSGHGFTYDLVEDK